MTEPKALACTHYSLAWICALPLELAAAQVMLEEIHPSLTSTAITNIKYTLGKVAGHNIVIACLPSGVYGTISATSVVSQIRSIFSNVRHGVMVGIGGGVPSGNADIRLGDVVVSKPTGNSGGVVHYDLGNIVSYGHFEHTGMLNQPPLVLLTAVSKIQARDMMREDDQILKEMSNVFRLHSNMEARSVSSNNKFSPEITSEQLLFQSWEAWAKLRLHLSWPIKSAKIPHTPSVFWIPATSIEAVEQAFMSINERLGKKDDSRRARTSRWQCWS